MNTDAKGAVIATAVAGLFIAKGAAAQAYRDGLATKVHCIGANACKGQSQCKSDRNACSGKNDCKGRGGSRCRRRTARRRAARCSRRSRGERQRTARVDGVRRRP